MIPGLAWNSYKHKIKMKRPRWNYWYDIIVAMNVLLVISPSIWIRT